MPEAPKAFSGIFVRGKPRLQITAVDLPQLLPFARLQYRVQTPSRTTIFVILITAKLAVRLGYKVIFRKFEIILKRVGL